MISRVFYIAGVARSGTSWLGQIFDSCPDVRFRFQPLFSYAFKDRVDEDSGREEFSRLFRDVYRSEDPFLLQSDKREQGLYPEFRKNGKEPFLAIKENRYQYVIQPMLRKCTRVQLVGIVRHPGAVMNSWMKNPKEFPPGADPRREWRSGSCKNSGPQDFFGFHKWKEVANLYIDLQAKYPDRVYLIHYEELVDNTLGVVEDLFEFCGLEMSDQTRRFLSETHERHEESPYAVFKAESVVDRWKEELDPYIASEIEADLAGTRLQRFIE